MAESPSYFDSCNNAAAFYQGACELHVACTASGLTRSLTHPVAQSRTHSPAHSVVDGLAQVAREPADQKLGQPAAKALRLLAALGERRLAEVFADQRIAEDRYGG